jgi:cell division protein FtsX
MCSSLYNEENGHYILFLLLLLIIIIIITNGVGIQTINNREGGGGEG